MNFDNSPQKYIELNIIAIVTEYTVMKNSIPVQYKHLFILSFISFDLMYLYNAGDIVNNERVPTVGIII